MAIHMKMILLSLVMLLIAFEPAFSGKILKKLDKELKKMGLQKLQKFLADIGENALDIGDVQNDIGDVQNEIGVIQNEIDSNTVHIKNNTMDIGNNTLDIHTNANEIDSNIDEVASNAINIASNSDKVHDVKVDVADNSAKIAMNDNDIGENSAQITINTADITKNANDIADHHPCKDIDYNILDDAKRNRNHDSANGFASPNCDLSTVEGDWKGGDSWYRFQEPAGTQLADSIVPRFHCGTRATGWLNGTHPAVLGENVIRQVNFNWNGNSSYFNTDVEIKNCGGYYLYKLKATPGCQLKYCGQ